MFDREADYSGFFEGICIIESKAESVLLVDGVYIYGEESDQQHSHKFGSIARQLSDVLNQPVRIFKEQ